MKFICDYKTTLFLFLHIQELDILIIYICLTTIMVSREDSLCWYHENLSRENSEKLLKEGIKFIWYVVCIVLMYFTQFRIM